jgi:hypothetical protein
VSGYGSETLGFAVALCLDNRSGLAAASRKRSESEADGRRAWRGSAFGVLPALLGTARATELQADLLLRVLHVLFGFLLSFAEEDLTRTLAALSGDFSGHQIQIPADDSRRRERGT